MNEKNGTAGEAQQPKEKETCGIIMPIADTDGYLKGHWTDVKRLLYKIIESAGFKPNLVSDATDSGIIHNRIVNNVYNNPIVICDVSSKNPNVMFELGLRLAFDKATIIIKDNITNYTFDASPIEHIPYPADLNYFEIERFSTQLKDKLINTYQQSKDPSYSTFLKHFVNYKRKVDEKEVGNQEFLFSEMNLLNQKIDVIYLLTESISRHVAEPYMQQDAWVDHEYPKSIIKNSDK